MDVSVIIPVYNQWHFLSALVDSFSQQRGDFTRELIIVDNGSDNIPNISREENVSVIKCKRPGSYVARNTGIAQAAGELILFTDADCFPDDSWLEKMYISYKQSDSKTMLAGNVIIKSNSDTLSSAELYDIVAGLPQQHYVSKGYAVTANLAIPRIVFDNIGTFDGSRFSGGDAEFCQRALKAGFNLQFVSEAIVYHPARKTWREYSIKVRRMKGGQIRAGKPLHRIKYSLITIVPPIWRFYRVIKNNNLKPHEKFRVVWFQLRLWGVEIIEMFALLLGKIPERR